MTATTKIKSLQTILKREEHTCHKRRASHAALRRFAEGITALRAERGLTQTAVCKEIGISVNQYSNLERAANWPSMPVYLRICEFFAVGVPPLTK